MPYDRPDPQSCPTETIELGTEVAFDVGRCSTRLWDSSGPKFTVVLSSAAPSPLCTLTRIARDCDVSVSHSLQYAYLAYFSKPRADRRIYRLICKHRVRSIVELGIGNAVRTLRMLRLAMRQAGDAPVRYAGIDLFEARPVDQAGLTFKRAYQLLMPLGVKLRLVPGDPFSAMVRVSNDLTGTDLVLVAADQDAESLARAWFYIPRMLHEQSLVCVEQIRPGKGPEFILLSRDEVDRLSRRPATFARAG